MATVVSNTDTDTTTNNDNDKTTNNQDHTILIDYHINNTTTESCILYFDYITQCIVLLSQYYNSNNHTHIILPIEYITDIYLNEIYNLSFKTTYNDNNASNDNANDKTLSQEPYTLLTITFHNEHDKDRLLSFIEQCTQLIHNQDIISFAYCNDSNDNNNNDYFNDCNVHINSNTNTLDITNTNDNNNIIHSLSLYNIVDVFIDKTHSKFPVCNIHDSQCCSIVFNNSDNNNNDNNQQTLHITAPSTEARTIILDQLMNVLNTLAYVVEPVSNNNNKHLCVSPRHKNLNNNNDNHNNDLFNVVRSDSDLIKNTNDNNNNDMKEQDNNNNSNIHDLTKQLSCTTVTSTPINNNNNNNNIDRPSYMFSTPIHKNSVFVSNDKSITPRQHFINYISKISSNDEGKVLRNDNNYNKQNNSDVNQDQDSLSFLLEGIVVQQLINNDNNANTQQSVFIFFDELDSELGSLCWSYNIDDPAYTHSKQCTIPIHSIMSITHKHQEHTVDIHANHADSIGLSLYINDNTISDKLINSLLQLIKVGNKNVDTTTQSNAIVYNTLQLA